MRSNKVHINISSDHLSAQIDPHGAELISLCDAQGAEMMSDGDPAFWSGRAPLLFPIVGQLRNDEYRLGSKTYSMEKHGFARRNDFVLREHEAGKAVFTLCSNDVIKEQYPFDFKLKMTFEIEGNALLKTAEVSNKGADDMPFSFGFHPAFAWPLPFGDEPFDKAAVDAHKIIFEQDEPAPIRRIGIEPGLIEPMLHDSPVEGNILSPSYAHFENDAMIWDDLNSRTLTWGDPQKTHLQIEFPDTPWLGLWQKPRAKYLCIEPWAGMADPVGFDGDFTEKPGMMILAPDESRSFRMNVRLKEN